MCIMYFSLSHFQSVKNKTSIGSNVVFTLLLFYNTPKITCLKMQFNSGKCCHLLWKYQNIVFCFLFSVFCYCNDSDKNVICALVCHIFKVRKTKRVSEATLFSFTHVFLYPLLFRIFNNSQNNTADFRDVNKTLFNAIIFDNFISSPSFCLITSFSGGIRTLFIYFKIQEATICIDRIFAFPI